MDSINRYDVVCVGGGLAGLSLSILLAKQGFSVAVLEKKTYPMHKVCGEYISLESWDFLVRLGLPLATWNLPIIKHLQMTALPNYSVETKLPLGGFGISRYMLDEQLMQLATNNGVHIFQNTNVKSFSGSVNQFIVETNDQTFYAKLLVGSFGKIGVGNFNNQKPTQENYVGIKYHLQYDFPKNKIALHNFKGGYAGISAIEQNNYCLCYMVKASVLKQYDGISEMNEQLLSKNIFLKSIFNNATFLWDKPVTISNIYFGTKATTSHQVIYAGDSAGAIPPLAGNGMSIALRSASVLAPLIIDFLNDKIDFKTLEQQYAYIWHNHFKSRINNGINLQKLFAQQHTSKWALQLFNLLKPLQSSIIKQTHGNTY
jgi:menaquinone-9 beta-reductase